MVSFKSLLAIFIAVFLILAPAASQAAEGYGRRLMTYRRKLQTSSDRQLLAAYGRRRLFAAYGRRLNTAYGRKMQSLDDKVARSHVQLF